MISDIISDIISDNFNDNSNKKQMGIQMIMKIFNTIWDVLVTCVWRTGEERILWKSMLMNNTDIIDLIKIIVKIIVLWFENLSRFAVFAVEGVIKTFRVNRRNWFTGNP